ncbi:hypothetical protein EYF80_063792 [Liparis tanakae]
MWRQQ